MTAMMVEHAAPRIASFPKAAPEAELYSRAALSHVGLDVVHEWLAHELGEDELARVEGLPVSLIASLYPEAGQTAFFSMVRGTPQLDELQVLLDAVARVMHGEGSAVLAELQKLQAWDRGRAIAAASQAEAVVAVDSFFVQSPEFLDVFSYEMNWAIRFMLQWDENWDSAWLQVQNLAMFVCAPQVVDPLYRDVYADVIPSYEGALKALGLDELWVAASARVAAWV